MTPSDILTVPQNSSGREGSLIMLYVFSGSEGRKYETVKQRKHLDEGYSGTQ